MTLPTVAALTAALAAHVEDKPESAAVIAAAEQALERVGVIVGARVAVVPDSIAMQAAVEVGAELYYRRQIRHGIVQMGDSEGGIASPVRVNRNPDAVAYPILAPWLGVGIA